MPFSWILVSWSGSRILYLLGGNTLSLGIKILAAPHAADQPGPNRRTLQKGKEGPDLPSIPPPYPQTTDFCLFLLSFLVLTGFRGPRAQEIVSWLRVELVNAHYRE